MRSSRYNNIVKNKKNILFILAAIIGLYAAWTLVQLGLTSKVSTSIVIRDTAIDAVPAIINVRSDYEMTLSSEESGRVQSSKLQLGKIIKAGELILTIDPTDLNIDADILRYEIENLEQQLALNTDQEIELKKQEEDLANFERQYESGNYPELEIIRRRREFKVFQENLKLRELSEAKKLTDYKNRLEKIERRLEKTKIYAPTDGIVTEIYAYPGELINSGSSLAIILSEAIVVEAKVNEEDFAGIKPGLDATVRLLTYGNKLYDAKISRVLPTADKENQQYTVFLEVEIAQSQLLPGLSGEASIIRRKIPDALIIPRRALVGDFVFKVEDGKAVFTPIKIGVRGLNNVEIREGLEENDTVITDGMSSLKDGDSVVITD